MVVAHDNKQLLKKLKSKVKHLQKKEEKNHAKLQAAIKKIHHLARDYKIKLAVNKQVMESRIAHARKTSYKKIILELENMIFKNIKTKVLSSVLEKIEKQHFGKRTKPAKKRKRKV